MIPTDLQGINYPALYLNPPGPQPTTSVQPGRVSNFNDLAVGTLNQLSNGDGAINNALQSGLSLANLFAAPGSFGRLNENLTPEQVELFARAKGESFLGGTRSDAMGDSLNHLRGLRDSAGNTDPVLQEILGMRKAGLDGLTAQENLALRERGSQAINEQAQTALRSLATNNALRGLRGGAAAAPAVQIANETGRQQRELERDIFLENIAEKNKRLNEYQGLASQIDANRFGRTQQAANAFNQSLFGAEQSEIADRSNRFNNFINLSNHFDQLGTQKGMFNMQQNANEIGTGLGLLFGAGSFGAAQQGQKTAAELAREQIAAAREGFEVPTIDFSAFANLFQGPNPQTQNNQGSLNQGTSTPMALGDYNGTFNTKFL